MNADSPRPAQDPLPRTGAVVLVYASVAALWILLSDRILEYLVRDPQARVLASVIKGWAFIAVTSLLLLVLLRRRGGKAQGQEPSSSWHRRRVWGFALLCLAVVGLLVLATINSLHEERDRAHGQLLAISESKSRELWNWHRERMSDAAWVRKARVLREQWLRWRVGAREVDGQQLYEFLRDFVRETPYARIELVDSDGHSLMDTGDPLRNIGAQPASMADPELVQGVQQSLRTDNAIRVGPWRDGQGRLRLAFLGPLATDTAHPVAVVFQLDPPDSIHQALVDWPLPQETAEALLFRRDGDQVRFLSDLRYEPHAAARKTLPMAAPQIAASLLRDEARAGELLEGVDYRGVPVLAVAQRVGNTEWWLLAKQDRSELLQSAMSRSSWMALAGSLALLALGSALYFYDERTRRLRSQHDFAELQRVEHSLGESEALYRLLADNSRDLIWLIDVPRNRFLYVSPSVERVLGYGVREVLELNPSRLVAPQNLDRALERYRERVRNYQAGDLSARVANFEVDYLHKDGRTLTFEASSTLVADELGTMTRLQTVSRDITQRKKDESELLRLSQALEQSPASVVITNLDGRIVYVNHAFERISGYSRDEALGRTPRFLRSGKTPLDVYADMWRSLGRGLSWHGELVNRRKDGHEYIQNMTIAPLRDPSGTVVQFLAVQLDVTAQRDAESQAHKLAWFSPLTDLPNRHRLQQEMQNVLSHRNVSGVLHGLLLINLDRFQTINDVLGHAAGDELLRRVGERLTRIATADDLVAHPNADEYAMLVRTPCSDATQANAHMLQISRLVHDGLQEPFHLDDHEQALKISCCVGITLLPRSPDDQPGDVLRRADTALHRAKESGTGQTALFDESMELLISRRFTIERDLRRGLAAGELRLFLQPQVNTEGQIVGAEALVRWQHPEHGLMTPGSFISIAERSDLITDLGRWVLDAVCAHLGALRRAGLRLTIAVNVSARQFHQSSFVQSIEELLARHEASANDLVLEITESIVIDQFEDIVQKMSRLTSLGIRFSLDDFGTGYSSLSYLKRLPIHELKIDRSFVQDAPSDPNDAALVEAILSVAQHLRLRVVAEGVETSEQAAFLNAHGHVVQQGFLHGRPAPAEEVLERWRRQQGA